MWRRVVCSGVVLLACNCSSKREEKKAEPSVAPAQQVAAIDAALVVPEPPFDAGDTWAHAAPPTPAVAKIGRFLGAYLDLLWVDVYLTEMLQAFPGAPATNRYQSYSYEWRLPDLDLIEKALENAESTAGRVIEASEADSAVLAYAKRARAVWPQLRVLGDYYKSKRFVDDEFAQGRQEAPLVAAALAALAPLRRPMIDNVFSGWRAAAGDKQESARAIVGAAFESCMRAAYLIFEKTNSKPVKNDQAERALDDAMSSCRRGVGAVSALPDQYRSFNEPLRAAAVAFGDSVSASYGTRYAVDDVHRLVRAYIDRWSQLPSEPAEKPGER